MRDHIHKIIAGGDREGFEYILNWLARLVQHPEEVGEIALVLRGKKGSGKSLLGSWIVRLFDQHGMHIVHSTQLVGRFNAHLRDCCVLFADEAFYAGDKQGEAVLKGLITERALVIEGKNQNIVVVRNMLHIILASNNDWVVPTSHDERRYAPYDVLDNRVGDLAYFAAIDRQMRQGGLAAMLYDLLQRDISGFEVRDVPHSAEMRTQKTLSLSSPERWWVAVLTRGYLFRSKHGAPWFTDWHPFYTTELLTNSYLQWCEENRPFDRKTREQLGMFLAEFYPASRPRVEHPVHENETIDRTEIRPFTKDGTVIDALKTLDEVAIVSKPNMPGYRVGDLDGARDEFAKRRDIVLPWRQGQEEDEDEDE